MSQARQKLFKWKNPYDHNGSSQLFLQAIRTSLVFHQKNCKRYQQLLQTEGITPDMIRSEKSLHLIPAVPTLYYKHHTMLSVDRKDLKIKAYSSGTSGRRSFVGFDRETCRCAKDMLVHFFCWHKLISCIPVNYLILGIAPEPGQPAGAYKTLIGAAKLAPAVHLEFTGAMSDREMITLLERYERQRLPIRIMGFPVFLEQLLTVLERNDKHFRFSRKSKILIGGGFKNQGAGSDHQKTLMKRVRVRLGIKPEQFHEFFSAVEHPIPYCKCSAGHFHIPVYSRVIIRDISTLAPVAACQPGLLNLITPLVNCMPLVSVITDDIAVYYNGGTCSCNNPAPYFKWLGRAGVDDIRTCAAQAVEQAGGNR